jgi:hypothetical protein
VKSIEQLGFYETYLSRQMGIPVFTETFLYLFSSAKLTTDGWLAGELLPETSKRFSVQGCQISIGPNIPKQKNIPNHHKQFVPKGHNYTK